jgi:hypothetical protein
VNYFSLLPFKCHKELKTGSKNQSSLFFLLLPNARTSVQEETDLVKMFLPAEPITGVAPKVAAEKFPKENP